jgi:hypothetical protein
MWGVTVRGRGILGLAIAVALLLSITTAQGRVARGRVTMAIGVGRDEGGVLRFVVGTSEGNAY